MNDDIKQKYFLNKYFPGFNTSLSLKVGKKYLEGEFKLKKEIKLWKIAKKKILHGNMLLSKRPEMHLPNIWPTYYLKAKGVNVWGLDKKKYTDMLFLVGPNTLGYANSRIDNEVIKTIKRKYVQPNCPEEVLLAENLISIHPWPTK